MHMTTIFLGLMSLSLVSSQILALGERPAAVRKAIADKFEKRRIIKKDNTWNFFDEGYDVASIDEGRFIEDIIATAGDKKDIWLVDCGGEQGGWSKAIFKYLKASEAVAKSDKRIYIVSVIEEYNTQKPVEAGNITVQWVNSASIEDIDTELANRGFDIKDKVDFLIFSKTMHSRVDPLGTLQKLYGLLTPGHGTLVSRGLIFTVNGNENLRGFPHDTSNVVQSDESKTILFTNNNAGRNAGDFALVRKDAQQLDVPAEYSGSVGSYDRFADYTIKSVSDARLEREYLSHPTTNLIFGDRWFYCNKGDERCKGFFEYLRAKKLLAWMAEYEAEEAGKA